MGMSWLSFLQNEDLNFIFKKNIFGIIGGLDLEYEWFANYSMGLHVSYNYYHQNFSTKKKYVLKFDTMNLGISFTRRL